MSLNLEYAKRWTDSTTIRGALIAALPVLKFALSAAGLEVKDEEWNSLIDAVVALAGFVGVIMAIRGRVKATATIVK